MPEWLGKATGCSTRHQEGIGRKERLPRLYPAGATTSPRKAGCWSGDTGHSQSQNPGSWQTLPVLCGQPHGSAEPRAGPVAAHPCPIQSRGQEEQMLCKTSCSRDRSPPPPRGRPMTGIPWPACTFSCAGCGARDFFQSIAINQHLGFKSALKAAPKFKEITLPALLWAPCTAAQTSAKTSMPSWPLSQQHAQSKSRCSNVHLRQPV